MASGLTSEPLNPQSGFNWVFLVELLICGILTVFFLFYFNRLFATLVSYGIRAYTWHNYHAYIDIQALQISFLGGRIFFKDIRYHGHNETILVHGGYITWQYWLRKVKDADLYTSKTRVASSDGADASSNEESPPRSGNRSLDRAEKGGLENKKQLPCRLSIKVSGVEAFMYNRSPAYDGIIEAMRRQSRTESHEGAVTAESVRTGSVRGSVDDTGLSEKQHSRLRKSRHTTSGGTNELRSVETEQAPPRGTDRPQPPSFLRLLPIHLDCNKGAIVVGNEHTPAVITAQFEKASGEIDAAQSGPLDVYQQVFNFQFTHPVVHMKPNDDFKTLQLESAARFKKEAHEDISDEDQDEKHVHAKKKRKSWGRLRNLSSFFSKSTDSISAHKTGAGKSGRNYLSRMNLPGHDRWKGLTRYLDDTQEDGHDEWDAVEYAKTSLIADCPCVNVSFYWDLPGPVPSEMDQSVSFHPDYKEDINGSVPPEYGMDIQIYGGTINYGPWTDRHRGIFQNIFFPGSHVDAVPAGPLMPGETRVLTVFKLFLSIEDDTVLRIPVRESSKDWKWKGKAHTVVGRRNNESDKSKMRGRGKRKSTRSKQREKGVPGPNVRPFAWLDVKVAANSSVNYIMDMVASQNGFHNKLDVDLRGTEIYSSVNHGLLWRSGPVALDCDLSNPLQWNTLRKWNFNISCWDLELFILRDHLFLLTDLVADWGSGPPPDYFTFVPFHYFLNVDFYDFKLYLNTNEANIVNNPADMDDNNFIILFGQHLHAKLTIPLDQYRPLQNEIPFDVSGQDLGLDLCMPPKITLNTFVRSKTVAQLGGVTVKGSHTYMTETSTANTDRLCLEITGTKLSLELYGFLIRHFMKIKDNYFGDDMHFKTLEEFQGLPSQSLAADATAPNGQHVKKSNDLDVILCIKAEEATVLAASNLYSANNNIRIDLPYAAADLRFTNYYMDLMVNFSPLSVSLGGSIMSPGIQHDTSSQTELFIESIDIFGHRLFGLPPTEPTYVCNWDFDVGKISGECSAELLKKAVATARCFAFSIDDDENALPIQPLVIHDSTFLRLRTQTVHVWVHVAEEALLIHTGPVSLEFNDLAGTTFSQRLKVLVPDLTFGCVDARSASRHRTRTGEKNIVKTHAFIQTTLSLTMLKRKLDFSEDRGKQQSHMREEDQRTNRIPFLILDDVSFTAQSTKIQKNVQPPAMQFPPMPQPISIFQHPSESSSLASSESFNQSMRGGHIPRPLPLRSSSTHSLAQSIRNVHKSQAYGQPALSPGRSHTFLAQSTFQQTSTDQPYLLPPEEERAKRGLPPSSLALSSSLATPYFPLDPIEPDMSDVPVLPAKKETWEQPEELIFNDVSTRHLDEDFVHTSFLISADDGIRVHCTPQAIRSAANLVDYVHPHQPEDILDAFQIEVMTKILDNQKRREGKGKSNEVSLRVPFTHVRFVNEFTQNLGQGSEHEKDQYDLLLDSLKVSARMKDFPGEQAGQDTLSLHTTLKTLTVSLKEMSNGVPNDDVAIRLDVSDVLLWVLKNREMSVNLSFRGLQTATASKKVEYLASLIHRTTMLGQEFATTFEGISTEQRNHLRYLAWSLTTSHAQSPDPAFISRPSYAMRATEGHLRSHDSWKIISRFRYIWMCLPSNERDIINHCCAQRTLACPGDAEERVISMWDQWRTWDLAHVKKSLAMRTLYGSMAGIEKLTHPYPIFLDVRSASVKLILDPGPKQSEASMRILNINLAIRPPPQPTGLMLVEHETRVQSIVVQISSRDSTVHVNWEICELAETLLGMFQTDESKEPFLNGTSQSSQHTNEKKVHQDFQVIYVTDNASLNLDGINIRSACMGHRLRFSLVGSDRTHSDQSTTITALVHFESAATELLSRSRLMLKSKLDQPSLYLSYYGHRDAADEIKIAGASQKVTVVVQEDILGFIEIIDAVLRDEVAYFHTKFIVLMPAKRPKSPQHEKKPRSPIPNVTVALFMDAYKVELGLLQSLTWAISGSFGRISVAPVPGSSSRVALRIDYDLDKHTHKMYSSTMHGSNVITTLEIPPANGTLKVKQTDKQTRIRATGFIDTITVQASEIQGLLSTINKPEMLNVFHAIRDDVDILKIHAQEVFPQTEKTPTMAQTESAKEFVFAVHFTFAGLNVLASAPGQSPESAAANLAFRLAAVKLKATNLEEQDNTVLILPEVTAKLQQISVEMFLSDNQSRRQCGDIRFSAAFYATAQMQKSAPPRRVFKVESSSLEVNIFADTASAVVDVVNHLQDRIKDLDLSKEKKYLKRLRHTKSRILNREKKETASEDGSEMSGALFTSSYSVELLNIQVSWIVGSSAISPYPGTELEDLVLSFRRIDLSTRKDDAARLMIEDMQLQMVPTSADKTFRSLNSALLPEVVFNVAYGSTKDTRKLAFQAAGKSLDLRLESRFILPAKVIEQSIALAVEKFRAASATWNMTPTTSGAQRPNPFGNKKLSSLLIDADFAGAVVQLQENKYSRGSVESPTGSRIPQKGRYGQFASDGTANSTSLRAPGVALRIEYKDEGREPSLNAELRVDASNNILFPTVVPLILDISNSVKEVVKESDESGEADETGREEVSQSKSSVKLLNEENLISTDPSALLGRTRLNLGIRICKQEFSLSCQPIARVAAVTRIEDIYVTFNSVKSQEQGHFFAVSAAFEKLQASVQHVYSRESTLGFDVDSIVLSMMNSKHLSGTSGISAILKVNPTKLQINARQLQDFLLFREIWIPPEVRQSSKPPASAVSSEPQEYLIQRYQQVSAATAFPWNANIAIAEVFVELDLGQAIGKTSLTIENLWASSRKSTDWEQNLCVGIKNVSIESSGRTSGFVELSGVKVRTSISWPSQASGLRQTPLIQASLGFEQLRVKAGFDYQAFVIADIANFDFLMYNVREQLERSRDRLVAILDGDKVHVFCTAISAAQGLALYQAIERLVQENQQAYAQSLKDIEKYLRRKSSVTPYRTPSQSHVLTKTESNDSKTPISLHTDVVVTLRSINLGAFPSTFTDTQIFMLEASDAQARFAVALEDDKIHSGLGMTLGQLSVALASVSQPKKPKVIGDLTVDDVAAAVRSARGGTILRVPKVIATMQTWQQPDSNHIEYIFKSFLEGKVDVGWNYSRISFIRTMWSNHCRSLASRLGKPLPESAVKISTSEQKQSSSITDASSSRPSSSSGQPQNQKEGEKITAVVNVPQSKYEYTAREPPLIETPQLRDMGEATPPLEWIGLHRDRLPNVTHQIVIVTLLEVAKEVEDAYGRILGSS